MYIIFLIKDLNGVFLYRAFNLKEINLVLKHPALLHVTKSNTLETYPRP